MGFNTQSNFQNGIVYDAWWGIIDAGERRYCATNGDAFVRILQTKLRNELPDLFDSEITGNGTALSVIGSNINIDGKVGRVTLAAAYYACQQKGCPANWLRALADDYRAAQTGQPIDRVTLKALVWLVSAGPLAELGSDAGASGDARIFLPVDTRAPLFNLAAPSASGAGAGVVTCWRESEAPPVQPHTTSTGTTAHDAPVTTGPRPWTTGQKWGAFLGALLVLGSAGAIYKSTQRPTRSR